MLSFIAALPLLQALRRRARPGPADTPGGAP
jgi:hypothetical protein